VLASGVWMYSSLQTGGLINKRYANEDALGRKKAIHLRVEKNWQKAK